MPEMGANRGMKTTEKDISFVTTDAEAVLTDETRHRALTGADLHDPKAHKTSHEDGGVDEMDVSGLVGAATKQTLPTFVLAATGTAVSIGDHRAYQYDSDGEYCIFCLQVPHDFVSLDEAYVIVHCASAVTDKDFDLSSEYGKIGEDYNNHSESDTTTTFDFPADEFAKMSLASVLSGIEAGDRIAIKITSKDTKAVRILRPNCTLKYN